MKLYERLQEALIKNSAEEGLSLVLKKYDEEYNDNYQRALEFSVDDDNPKILKALLEHGRCDPTPAVWMVNSYYSRSYSLSSPYQNYAGALPFAANDGKFEIVALLLKDGRADPRENDSAALRWAASNGHTEIVKILLKDGRADPEAVCMDFVHSAEITELIKNEITRREALV